MPLPMVAVAVAVAAAAAAAVVVAVVAELVVVAAVLVVGGVVAVPVVAEVVVVVAVAVVAVVAELVVVVAVLVELARLELEREWVLERDLVPLAADMAMMSDFLTPVHAGGSTLTPSAPECFLSKGGISLGLAAVGSGLVTLGLVAPLLVGITHARPTVTGL